MGSPQSGRWKRYRRKRTVNEYLKLDISSLVKAKAMAPGIEQIGDWNWSLEGQTAVDFWIRYQTNTIYQPYTFTVFWMEPIKRKPQDIPLQSQPCHYGGVRWWFLCACQKRVTAVYTLFGHDVFKCRHCYDLSYISCQESHKYDNDDLMIWKTPRDETEWIGRRGRVFIALQKKPRRVRRVSIQKKARRITR